MIFDWFRKKRKSRPVRIDTNKDINDLLDKINEVLKRPEYRDRRVRKLHNIFKMKE